MFLAAAECYAGCDLSAFWRPPVTLSTESRTCPQCGQVNDLMIATTHRNDLAISCSRCGVSLVASLVSEAPRENQPPGA
jgi:ribosomal protein S27AE